MTRGENTVTLVIVILTLVGLGFAAMSTNPLFVVPIWVPVLFFILAGLTILALVIYVLFPKIKQGGSKRINQPNELSEEATTVSKSQSKKEHEKELQLLRKSLIKAQISAEILVKLLREDTQIPDRIILEAKGNYRNATSRLLNEYLAYNSNDENRMKHFIARLTRGRFLLDQCFGADHSYRKFKAEIIENFESIAKDAKYIIVNWKHLGFYIQD
ncbi:MAG: hypothetical protein PHO26_00325 [Dehalococcoidia bacterium]|nr:hypothetical protein [Dehalococcoidia bacterium]MDD5493843.1 hypothetical protein [Dehalococcoidia bacterium]